MQLTTFRRNGGVPAQHLDAALHGALEHRHQGIRIVGGDGDGVDLLSDQRVDDFDLRFGRRGGRAGIDQLDIAEFGGSFLGALGSGVEEAVAERLHDQRDAGLVLGKNRAGEQHGGGRSGGQQFQKLHRFLPPWDEVVFMMLRQPLLPGWPGLLYPPR